MLHHAPALLRFVEGPDGPDALDAPGDAPLPDEKITVYQLDAPAGMVHIQMADRRKSGFYAMAQYRVLQEQPDEADVRDSIRWRRWQEERRGGQVGRQTEG